VISFGVLIQFISLRSARGNYEEHTLLVSRPCVWEYLTTLCSNPFSPASW